jgi:hypothetical protein
VRSRRLGSETSRAASATEVATLGTAAVPSGGSALATCTWRSTTRSQLDGTALELMAKDDPPCTDITVRRAIAF